MALGNGPRLPAGARRSLYLLGLLIALKSLIWLLLAQAVVTGIVSVISDDGGLTAALLTGAAAALARAAVVWAIAVVARQTALGAKEDLRLKLAGRMVLDAGRGAGGQGAGGGAGGQGAGTVLATRGLDALDNYYTAFLPAVVGCATMPLLIGARILLADWVSALIVILTVPLVPLFMVLIGMHTREQVERAADSLSRLSNHLLELARGLPVLVGLGRAKAQTEALRKVSEDYRRTTMGTLRVAFLSALALELVATLSVAVVAVFIGVRLVQGSMDLETGLLVLILAPECYLPLRELGTAHHASEDGREALERAEKILAAPVAVPLTVRVPAAQLHSPQADDGAPDNGGAGDYGGAGDDGGGRPREVRHVPEVRVSGLRVSYPDRSGDAVSGLSFTAPAGQITAISGPSGCGKSTLLHVLAGIVAPLSVTETGLLGPSGTAPQAATATVAEADADAGPDGRTAAPAVQVSGQITGVDPEHLAWVPQHPATVAQTARAEVELYGAGVGTAPRGTADELLNRVGLGYAAARHPAELSPGELRRLALARALARIEAGATVLL
ncbi:MAG: ABC transporter transmembrane domain-containing protein, partial [Actinomycetota bacterium]|nr:ABC transporter transmembrane domain-containing protein [Actinomycetota bacterium]